MDAVTAVSGSGPAYVFLLAESLAHAGEAAGLPRQPRGAACPRDRRRLGRTDPPLALDPAQLRQNVTSPGGTTAAALDILMGD